MRDEHDAFGVAMIVLCEALLIVAILIGVTIGSVMQWWQ